MKNLKSQEEILITEDKDEATDPKNKIMEAASK